MLPQISCVWQGEGWCRMNTKDHQITKETPTFTLMNQLYSSRNREANLQVCQSLTFGYSISQTSPILLNLLHNQCIFPTSSRLLLPHPSNPCWMLLKHECSCLTCWKLRMYAGLLEATIIMYAGSYGYAYESLFLPAWSLLYCSCALRLFRLLPLLTVASAAMHPRKQLGGVRWKCRLLSGCEHGCLSLFMSMLFWLNVNSRILGALRQVKALPGSKIKPCTSHPVKKCSPATLHACPAVKLAPVPGLPEGGGPLFLSHWCWAFLASHAKNGFKGPWRKPHHMGGPQLLRQYAATAQCCAILQNAALCISFQSDFMQVLKSQLTLNWSAFDIFDLSSLVKSCHSAGYVMLKVLTRSSSCGSSSNRCLCTTSSSRLQMERHERHRGDM